MSEREARELVGRVREAVRAHDAPAGVDREAMLQRLMAQTSPAPQRGLSRAAMLAMGFGALALLTVGVARMARVERVAQGSPVRAVVNRAADEARPMAPTVTTPAPAVVAVPSSPVVAETAAAPAVARRSVAARTAGDGDEWRIVREADGALQAREPERALEILARHTARHPRGVATPEVMAYRVRAYCMAGRVDEAESTARRLRARAPDSPAAYSLRATCVSQR